MSNDKTTLADVQPGGRVRLGDSPRITMSEDDFANMVETVAGEHGEMLEDGGPYNGWCFSCEELIEFSRGVIIAWGMDGQAQESAQPSRVGEDPVACRYRHRRKNGQFFPWVYADAMPEHRIEGSEYEPLYSTKEPRA